MIIKDIYFIYKIAWKNKLSDVFYINILNDYKYYLLNYKEYIKQDFMNINDKIKIYNKEPYKIYLEHHKGSTKKLILEYKL